MKQFDKIIFNSLDNLEHKITNLAGMLTLGKISDEEALSLCKNYSTSLVYLNNLIVEQIENKIDEYTEDYNKFSKRYIELDNNLSCIIGLAKQNLDQQNNQANF